MTVTLVAAMTEDRVIGRDNSLPWHLPADLRHFKRVTMGKPMIMGRRTWESVGTALPGRRTIVVTRQAGYEAAGAEVAGSLEEALALVADAPEVCVVGGAGVYAQALPLADRMELTLIHARGVEGDSHFPAWEAGDWVMTNQRTHPADADHRWAMSFQTFERAR